MTREWIAAYTGLLNNLRYRRLPAADRGGLLHVWLLATTTTPEATFPSAEYLADNLELDGFDRELVDRLIRARWLELDETDRVLVHDWDEHQYEATRASVRAYEADRKHGWRLKNRNLPHTPSRREERSGSRFQAGNREKRRDEMRRDETFPGHVRDVSRTRTDGGGFGAAPSPVTNDEDAAPDRPAEGNPDESFDEKMARYGYPRTWPKGRP